MGRMLLLLLALLGVTTPLTAPVRYTPEEIRATQDLTVRMARRYKISENLSGLILTTSQRYDMETRIAYRLVWTESRFNPRAKGKAGEIGLTQLMPSTARKLEPRLPMETFWDPGINLDVGFRYYRMMLDRYKGDQWLALTAYNRGPAVADSLRRIRRHQRQGYADGILARS